MVVDNIVIHHCENFHSQSLLYSNLGKKEKSGKISIFLDWALFTDSDLHISFFLSRSEYNECVIENFHSGGSQYYLQSWFFLEKLKSKFTIFFETELCLHVAALLDYP